MGATTQQWIESGEPCIAGRLTPLARLSTLYCGYSSVAVEMTARAHFVPDTPRGGGLQRGGANEDKLYVGVREEIH